MGGVSGRDMLWRLWEQDTKFEDSPEFSQLAKAVVARHQAAEIDSPALAVDKLGLSLLNMFYGPFKIGHELQQGLGDAVRFNYTADFPLADLE